MEEFDLVDEQDNVIGVTTKEKAHADGGIHRVAAVFVFAKDGRLYLQEHLKSDGALDHSVGGHVHRGESYDDAARREAEEELGITAPLAHISTFYSDERSKIHNRRHMFGLYECVVPDAWTFTPNEEVKNIIPIKLSDVVAMMNTEPQKFTGGFKNTLREYVKKKNLPLTFD